MKNIPIRSIRPCEEPRLSGSFSIRNLNELLGGKEMVQALHRHDFIFILVIEKGSGKHEIDFVPYLVDDNCVFFIRPGQVHQITLHAESTGYLLQFDMEFYHSQDKALRQLLYRKSDQNKYQFDTESMKRLYSVLDHISEEYSSQAEGYDEVIRANLDILLIQLARTRKSNKEPKLHITSYHQERLEELQALIEMHIHDCKQVSQYADLMSLSSYQLNVITKETLGKNCSELINEFIVLESKRHLLATSNQVVQIAYQLGYDDVSYFIRFFKKHTGYTPEVFRHNFR